MQALRIGLEENLVPITIVKQCHWSRIELPWYAIQARLNSAGYLEVFTSYNGSISFRAQSLMVRS